MIYNWKLPAFLVAPVENTKKTVLSSFIKGEVEGPLQSRDCAGRVPLTSGLHPQKFQADGSFWVLVCIFVRFGFGKTSIFTVHVMGQQRARRGSRWPCACGTLFSGTGGWFRARDGPRGGETLCLGTGTGVPSHFLQSLLALCLARRACLRPQDRAPASIFPSTGRKTTKERKKIYIYIYIYII